MMDEKVLICIRCPRGCRIQVHSENGLIKSIEGNVCRMGEEHAKSEMTDPRRVVTTTVRVKDGRHPLVPVVTTAAVPKAKVFDLVKLLRSVELNAPVHLGQIVLKDPLDIGIDVKASGNCPFGSVEKQGAVDSGLGFSC